MVELIAILPGADLVEKGLQDLHNGRSTVESLLVLVGAPRLRRAGIAVPIRKDQPAHPEHALYEKLQAQNARGAHSRYNALVRRLVSYERAIEQSRRH